MKTDRYTFLISSGIIILFVLVAVLFTEPLADFMTSLQAGIVGSFGWFYILVVGLFLLFIIGVFVSPYGAVKLGREDDEPEFSYASWFAMLFSAGMGIGLLFYGVAEPVLHYTSPPFGEGGTLDAARQAMTLTYLHWGLHAWAVYIVVGLSLAYFAYRHGLPLTIRSTLYPLLGERIHGPIGRAVDIFAIFGTLFGVATSLGVGVMQVNAGLDYLGLMDVGLGNQLWLIAGITLIATASVASGLGRGIRRLSELNMVAGLLLLVFVFAVGPTVWILFELVDSIGRYIQTLPYASFRTMPFAGIEWQASWTMFYWGWWISWAPFVGMFIARVSKGRTIREFIGGVLFAPVLLSFVWFSVFGGTALHMEVFGAGGMAAAVEESVPTALFAMLDRLPLPVVSSAIGTLMVGTFFVTSADSGALVMDIISSNGDPEPPMASRLFWAVLTGTIAAVLLVVGGLGALQTAAIATALPFSLVMILMCVSLVNALSAERRHLSQGRAAYGMAGAAVMGGDEVLAHLPEEDWRQRLQAVTGRADERTGAAAPGLKEARRQAADFITGAALPAFKQIARELERQRRTTEIAVERYSAGITVLRDGNEEFSYTVRSRAYHPWTFAFPELETEDEPWIAQAEVILRGGLHKNLPLEGADKDTVLRDFVAEYAKWMGW
ncbi:BCCT family transporter [Indioceanicola profundi]|uniref:BCCT family transporter n=1 Tax=Indioceanicola profundi TaxID=2220096 RepID=UPI000E6AA0E6|nr:BCCT family transporter [Indioceanicola profundi]